MSDDLKKLADARNDLLMAEAIGWLHDYRKCSEEHLQTQAANRSNSQALPRAELANRQPNLQNIPLHIPAPQPAPRAVIGLLDSRTWNQDFLGRFLSRCHNTAHFDKQEPVQGEQNYPGVQISSSFGFEESVASTLTNNLWGLPWGKLATISADRQELKERISTLFSQTIADSRRPINEVDLWSWSSFVGMLYKAALAGALLTGITPAPKDLHWRLLSIRIDGLEYISDAVCIPDSLVRQQLLTDSLDKVRELLEVRYPMGSEVYRDQNGSVYIVPDIPDLLKMPDSNGATVQTLIVQAFEQGTVKDAPRLQLGGEIVPSLTLEQNSWWGQDPNWSRTAISSNDKLPNIKGMLVERVITHANAESVESYWQGQQASQVCPVCSLRPMQQEGREACETCEQRRISRTKEWHKNPSQTIWMDEITDHNGRVALIVGKFGLDDWLSGDLVQTMLVRADPQNREFVPKNPSPARLRRIWETCRQFWTRTVEHDILLNHSYGTDSRNAALRCLRLTIEPHENDSWEENIPFDGTLNGRPISLLWDRSQRHFITVINLQLTTGEDESLGQLQQAWPGCVVEGPDPMDPRKRRHFIIQKVEQAQGDFFSYRPFLTFLTSPDQFLALVPSSEALDVAGKIRSEYQNQFGKVQNRLPLFLGLVFFQRKLPLMAVMDTARRMIGQVQFKEEKWLVSDICSGTVKFANGIEWHVATTMGDGSPDIWYPYYRTVDQVASYPRCFDISDGKYKGRWAHIKDLAGQQVIVMPSRFTYIFLETTAQRFHFHPEQRVMLLDELPRLMEMWKQVCGSPNMSDTKLQAIHALFEGKRQEWKLGEPTLTQPITDDIFCQLVETTLRWDKVQGVKPEDVLNGRFHGCLNLFLHMLRRRVSDERKKKEAQNEPATL